MQKTPLIQLKNVGKIYVSEGNVAVGIRGVDLSFDRGEFVAITGASGSGKSTLLNVISGMDTYEEGEMLVEGEPTSHYIQKDWETYREDYISFIFQDYNIIESFTVLQNVELALFHIEDPVARRERAMELLRRVGMEGHIKHKGSKLSGGQKQRTVIARALAKDSPVILADEPTGNLDSKSSREIIDLLHEISRDKLVIIVTHNFDEVEHCATRHIRIFDGAVELDHTLRPIPEIVEAAPSNTPIQPPSTGHTVRRTLRDGLRLGLARFGARPKLAVFLCCLMTLAALVITFMTATSYSVTEFFDKPHMFTYVEGRTVIAREDGAVITDEELAALATELGATDWMHYDFMLDRTLWITLENENSAGSYQCSFGYPATDLTLDAGRLPARDDEVILEVPISAKRYIGNDFAEFELPTLFDMATYRVVGVRYFYDNTRQSRLLFTENGYKVASAMAFFSDHKDNFKYLISAANLDQWNYGEGTVSYYCGTFVDFNLPAGSYYINLAELHKQTDMDGNKSDFADIGFSATLMGSFYDYASGYKTDMSYADNVVEEIYPDTEKPMPEQAEIMYSLADRTLLETLPVAVRARFETYYNDVWQEPSGILNAEFVVLSPDVLTDFMYEHYYESAYTQASLFFGSDRAAHASVETLRNMGYIAVPSDETVEPDMLEVLMTRILLLFDLGGWILTVFLTTMLLYLCTSRAMNAVRGDIAIMRSMGIPTAVIRVGIHVQTFLSLIPALLVTAIGCIAIYTIPATNAMFTFLHAPDYIILAIALIAVAFFLSRKQVGRMFRESVKKTMRGGKKS